MKLPRTPSPSFRPIEVRRSRSFFLFFHGDGSVIAYPFPPPPSPSLCNVEHDKRTDGYSSLPSLGELGRETLFPFPFPAGKRDGHVLRNCHPLSFKMETDIPSFPLLSQKKIFAPSPPITEWEALPPPLFPPFFPFPLLSAFIYGVVSFFCVSST